MLLGQNVRNKIINGRFDYWQRGNSFNLATSGRTADRWAFAIDPGTGSVAAGTVSKQAGAFLPGQTSFMRINNTTTGTQSGNSYAVLPHSIEDVRTFSGKTVTLSIWASSTIASKQIRFYCSQYFGTGGSSTISFIPTAPTQSTHTLTTSVARYDVTFDIPSITGKTVGTSSRLEFGVVLAYGPTNSASFFGLPQLDWQGTGNIDIYGIQVNEGPPADFELAGGGDPGAELALCQRYYEILPAWYDTRNIVSTGNSYPYNTQLQFKVEKRAAPVMSYTINATSFSALAFSAITTRGAVFGVATGATGFSASSYVYVDSFTADAEF